MKMVINYEVEGCWTSGEPNCRLCGTVLQQVPRKGHHNSKYWRLERDDGAVLVCCPIGCDVKSAEKKVKEYMGISRYCKDNSQSWSYEFDYDKIQHAWIDKQGRMHPCEYGCHRDFAFQHNTTEHELETKGWLKLASKEFLWIIELSKQQIDRMFDYILITGTKGDMKRMRKHIDDKMCI